MTADRPRSYPQLLRGPDHRWWRPLVSLTLAAALMLVVLVVVGVVVLGAVALVDGADGVSRTLDELDQDESAAGPAGFLLNNLLLASLIPVSMLAVWLVHRWPPRWLASVAPGLRWGWLAECTGWAVLFVGALLGLGLLMYPDDPLVVDPQDGFWLLLVIVLLTTPLQAAGEEYGFRGLLTQAVGSWFRGPVAAALVGGAVSAVLFALAHGSQSPWLFADRLAFGVVASYLVWRTGGLEAAIALHTVNNIYALAVALVTGTLEESLLSTEYPASAALVDMVLMALFAVLVTWRARRRALVRVHDPARQPDVARQRREREAARWAGWAQQGWAQQAWAQQGWAQQGWAQQAWAPPPSAQQWPPPAGPAQPGPPLPLPPPPDRPAGSP